MDSKISVKRGFTTSILHSDRDAPIEPNADMFERLGDVALGVLELKLLSQINGDVTPRSHRLTVPASVPSRSATRA